MRTESFKRKWIHWSNSLEPLWSFILFGLIGITFLVSDWLGGILSFSDYLIALIVVFMGLIGQLEVKKNQILWLMIPVLLVIANILFHSLYTEEFSWKLGVSSLIKVIGYELFVVFIYNYIDRHSKEKQFFQVLNWVAVVACVIGIYITVALYSDGMLPYRFFWDFTRYDIYSYMFESNPAIIRTRGLFSEPAHLGFFLNMILALNYFNNQKVKIHWCFSLIITATIFMTFSYSMIGIMIMIQVFKIIQLGMNHNILWHHSYWLVIIGCFALIFFFREFIQVTLLDRTLALINGTDVSARMRIIESWQYIHANRIFSGNGIGHTPVITNIYAYLLSDLGIAAFIGGLCYTFVILKKNLFFGLVFTILNISRGGYLGPAFWLLILVSMLAVKPDTYRTSSKKTSIKF
ncbi:hypothetical protein [Marinilactibacillus psychrotolerans]|uniref:Uncharacterized protein n=1 Tax=Marinilactibacillus psychrotolerans TaxID=191770 RepID=A0A5R9C0Q3_9LACT|nr:hypothetical protein [Marinilactibacillus psychrotolerans]TLQ06267.1 hypothetical protein FEZ48_10520 [Marinilactibacillus psychrotolerans]